MNEAAETAGRSSAAQLRAAFDSAFAAPYAAQHGTTADYIALRLGEDIYALALSEIAGLHSRVTIVPCPSPIAELMGLAGFRGALVPVYDLSVLLGHPPVTGRWLALTADRSVALAFDEFVDHFRIETTAIASAAGADRHHIHSIARYGEHTSPIVDLASLVGALRQRAARANPKRE